MFVLQLCALSHPPCSPCDLWVRVNIQDVPSNVHNGPPFTSQGRTERRRRRTFSQTSDSLSLHLSIISPHLSEQSRPQRLCPHPPTATRPPVCRPFSQTNPLSPYPPSALQGQGCALCEPVPKHAGNSQQRRACRTNSTIRTCIVKKQQQTVCLFSSIAADSKASMCHLLPCANSARCHCRTQTEGVVEG